MIRARSAGPLAAFLVLAIAGCAAPGQTRQPLAAHRSAAPAVPLAGTRLTALLAAPRGFTAETSRSYDSGDTPISGSPGSNPQRISCASWWAGNSYYGPGEVGYAVKEFTRPEGTTVTVMVILYRQSGGAEVYDASAALHDRCTRFRYRDASDFLWYQVDVKPASPAGLGDRSQTYDATESRDGGVFPTEVTFIQVGDATIGINQTGPAGSTPVRIIPSLTRLIAALRAAGY